MIVMGEGDGRSMVGPLCVLAAALLWGTTGVAAHYAPSVNAFAIGAVAMGVGGLLQAVRIVPQLIRHPPSFGRRGWRYMLMGVVGIVIYPLAFYGAMRLVGVAVGTVVSIGTAPLFSALIEWGGERKPLSYRWAVGAVCGGVGIMLLGASRAHEPAVGIGALGVWGIVLGLVAGATYALYSWCAQRVMQGGCASDIVMGIMFGLAGLCLVPVMYVTGAGFVQSYHNALIGLYLAVVPMWVGYMLFGKGLATVPASTATLLTLAEPMVATCLAVYFVGERLSYMGWCGLSLMGLSLCVTVAPASLCKAIIRAS